MKNNRWYFILGFALIVVVGVILLWKNNQTHEASGVISSVDKNTFTVSLESGNYRFTYLDNRKLKKGDSIEIEYKGKLKENEKNTMKSYSILESTMSLLDKVNKNGLFGSFYNMAYAKLEDLSLKEKIGQILLVRVPENNAVEEIKKYQFGGYVLFARDFANKSKKEVWSDTNRYQKASSIPMIIATDEEGGNVVRASSNSKLIDSPFKSSQTLYNEGGFDLIWEDTIKKSNFLSTLGVNVNLAPVSDVSTNSNDYMYARSFGKDTSLTSEYVETVIKASKKGNVSYTLKHFPGYGNNVDTHTGSSVDTRSYDDIINNDIPPFKAGIEAKAEAVMVSHNIVNSIEKDVPASLSKKVHQLLREDLGFEGVIITDDMDMGAITTGSYTNVYVKAIEAGNDLIIVTDYESAFNELNEAVNNGNLSEDMINEAAFRVLAWKYYKLLFSTK